MPPFDPLFLEFQGAVNGRYSLERELGRGGMGVVYLAHELRLDRLVAIKVLPPELAANPALRDRFLREARTAARLSHPNIVAIHSVDEAGAFVYYAMAFVDGETLGDRLRNRGPMSSTDASRALREVAWALGHAHAQGVVHRDVKPANILIERSSGRALVTDFGIARLTRLDGATTEGERLGTPEYMSPEQAAGDALDGRSDIYSLGVVGFVAVTGRHPFTADSAQSMLAQHITQPAPAVLSIAPSTRPALAEAIDRCLQKEAAMRFADASVLADALGDAVERRPEVPIPVRLFLDRRRTLGPVALFAVAMLGPLGLVLPIWNGRAILTPASAPVIGYTLIALLIPLAAFFNRLRRLAEAGYGPDDLVIGLREGLRRSREEFEFEFGSRPGRTEVGLWTLAVASTSIMLLMGAIGYTTGTRSLGLLRIVAFPLGIGVFGVLGAVMLARARKATKSVWERFWASRFGRTVAKVAAIGVDAKVVHADRPTEVAIALSARALFDELSDGMRRELAGFPEVMQTLEDRATALRARLQALDADAVEAGRLARLATNEQRAIMADNFEHARSEANDQLRAVVTALGTLRLDLLRLRVGSLTLEGVTADLSVARDLGDEARRLLEAKQEVERAVRPLSPRPT